MERTERLLDLLALFLDARGPLSFPQIREAFPLDYAGAPEAAMRKFERDKADLLELGIPITFHPRSDDAPEGYVVDKDAYYLPEVGLTPEELAVLYAAGSAALLSGVFPGREDLAHALRKIGFFSGREAEDAGGPLPAPKVRLELGAIADTSALPARLETVWSAITSRKSVDVEYFSPRTRAVTRRRVDPYGLALRRGVWSMVGHCHLRRDIRVFHVHRCRDLTVNRERPRSFDFEVPADFRLDRWVATWPWQHRFHPPVQVTVTLSGSLSPLAEGLFGVAPAAPGEVEITATDLDGLLSYILGLGSDARVVRPPEAVSRIDAMARAVLEAHRGEAV